MGGRNRSGEKVAHRKLIATMHENAKRLSRRKAENMLRAGADPTTKDAKGKGIFTLHDNYHVRAKAFRLMGSPFPQDIEECEKLCVNLHIKNPNKSEEIVLTSEIETTE